MKLDTSHISLLEQLSKRESDPDVGNQATRETVPVDPCSRAPMTKFSYGMWVYKGIGNPLMIVSFKSKCFVFVYERQKSLYKFSTKLVYHLCRFLETWS